VSNSGSEGSKKRDINEQIKTREEEVKSNIHRCA
jgi:hypothetical protein